ncbi:MAG: hypothetical protein EBU90_07155 [Proteobacteria bacterium]|nr:hypothetical protein [Pseudomonadota bacterium]
MEILIPVSAGELIDKITILRIKSGLIRDPEKKRHVDRELDLLDSIRADLLSAYADRISQLEHELHTVNLDLWHIEDFKRDCERRQRFDTAFIEAARAVYQKNDLRAQIKQEINRRCGSLVQEQKSHQGL